MKSNVGDSELTLYCIHVMILSVLAFCREMMMNVIDQIRHEPDLSIQYVQAINIIKRKRWTYVVYLSITTIVVTTMNSILLNLHLSFYLGWATSAVMSVLIELMTRLLLKKIDFPSSYMDSITTIRFLCDSESWMLALILVIIAWCSLLIWDSINI